MSSVTVFTSNQPRHLALISRLAEKFDTVYAVMECNTIFPGEVADFYQKTNVMKAYFQRVIAAEDKLFGQAGWLPDNVMPMVLKMGDLNYLDDRYLHDATRSKHFVVFGASYIKGWLCEFLESKRAINIHMGMSPWFRGSATNFWALQMRMPHLVGATIHRLTKGLDSGPILFHALPEVKEYDPFDLGMAAVDAGICGMVEALDTGRINEYEPVAQDRSKEVMNCRYADFTDEVAADYLECMPDPEYIQTMLGLRKKKDFIDPYVITEGRLENLYAQ